MNKKNKKGFTLVELLAVIVILAVIMIVAIPSVLTIMTTARIKSFEEYVHKVVAAAEKKYMSDSMIGEIPVSSCYLYNITKSLGLDNTGDFKGYVLIDTSKKDKLNYYLSLYNSEYKLMNFNYTKDNKKINDYIESIEDKIDDNKVIYELGIVSTNCTSISYNLEDKGYNDSFEYESDMEYSSHAELIGSYLKTGAEVNFAIKMFSDKAVSTCDDGAECLIYEDSKITSIEKTTSAPPESAVVISTKASKYPTYAWLDGTTVYYKSEGTIYMNADSSDLFSYYSNLTSLDLSSFDTSQVINLSGIFQGDLSLASLDLSNFNTSNVMDMSYMFSNCKSLVNLNISSFNTSSVIYMFAMFESCSSLTSLDLSHFNTKSLKSLAYAFANMKKLKSINLSNLDTSNVTTMACLFQYSTELQELDLSSFDTSSVENMGAMFAGLTKLKKLNISNFNTSKVREMTMMFADCYSLNNIIGFEKITTESARWMISMFSNFQANVANGNLDLSNFNTLNVTNMQSMFEGAFTNSKTISLNLGEHFYTSNVTNMQSMFNMFAYTAPSFTLDLGPNFDTSKVTNMQFMFQSVGRGAAGVSANVIFGSKFKFKKGVNTSKMFLYFLQGFPTAEVFLPYMVFPNIGFHNHNMFYGWPKSKKLYVDSKDYAWVKKEYSSVFDDTNLYTYDE